MNKILMGASIVALTSTMVSGAHAAEWDLNWRGGYVGYAVYTDEEGNGGDGFDIHTDGELTFDADIVLENQLQFGVVSEIEIADASDTTTIDDTYLYVDGGFGRVELGNEGSVFGQMHKGFSSAGKSGVGSGTVLGYFGHPDTGAGYNPSGHSEQIAGSALRINYYTPRFAGFQVGVSYSRGTNVADRVFENRNTEISDVMAIAANYEGTFGGASIAASVGYETADDPGTPGTAFIPRVIAPVVNRTTGAIVPANVTLGQQAVIVTSPAVPAVPPTPGADLDRYNVGLQAEFGAIRMGGSYAHYEDNDFFDVGIGYKTAGWDFSIAYALNDASGGDTSQVGVGATYGIGPGVAIGLFAGYVDSESTNSDGFGVGSGIELSF